MVMQHPLIESLKKKMREGALAIFHEFKFEERRLTPAKLEQCQSIPPANAFVFTEEQLINALELAYSKGFEQSCKEREVVS